MKKTFDDYTLLAGHSGLRGSLWQGPDHLLVIEARGFLFPYREIYRRIDYKNIQALTLSRTRGIIWISLLLGLALAGFAAGLAYAINTGGFGTAAKVLTVPVALLTILLSNHLLRGKNCICALQTAVLSLRLKPLKRARKAQAVLQQIEDLCRQHQGAMPPEAAMLQQSPSIMPSQIGIKPEWRGSKLTQWTLILLLLWGVMFAGMLFANSMAYMLSNIGLALVLLMLIVAAIAKVMKHRATGGLAGILWGGLAGLFLAGMTYYGMFIASLVAFGNKNKSPGDAIQWMANLDFQQAKWGAWIIIALGLIVAVLALFGLPLTVKRAPLPQAPAMPPTPPPAG